MEEEATEKGKNLRGAGKAVASKEKPSIGRVRKGRLKNPQERDWVESVSYGPSKCKWGEDEQKDPEESEKTRGGGESCKEDLGDLKRKIQGHHRHNRCRRGGSKKTKLGSGKGKIAQAKKSPLGGGKEKGMPPPALPCKRTSRKGFRNASKEKLQKGKEKRGQDEIKNKKTEERKRFHERKVWQQKTGKAKKNSGRDKLVKATGGKRRRRERDGPHQRRGGAGKKKKKSWGGKGNHLWGNHRV